mmetsp:Transcript_2081/g.2640  ORF Transcript_2081/g.2640 Transcript_2081/m.2640 type:complete len:138 (-) Transcript_2081:1359-1772(-)
MAHRGTRRPQDFNNDKRARECLKQRMKSNLPNRITDLWENTKKFPQALTHLWCEHLKLCACEDEMVEILSSEPLMESLTATISTNAVQVGYLKPVPVRPNAFFLLHCAPRVLSHATMAGVEETPRHADRSLDGHAYL